MAEGMTPADMSAVLGNRGYDGMDGFGGAGWFWIIIVLFAFMGNGFGWNNNGVNNLATTDFISSEFTQRDIAGVNQNISTTSASTNQNICDMKYDLGVATLENRYATQLGIANSNNLMQQCCCETQKEIAGVNYNLALQTQQLSSQLANEECATRANSTANTQKILDKLCDMEINDLRTQLANKDRQVQELQLESSQISLANGIVNSLRPAPIPAYMTLSPYQSIYNPFGYGNGCGCNGYNTLV